MNRILFALLLLLPLPAFAWGDDGHRILCAIAWEDLQPLARTRVQDLLEIRTSEEFSELCLWADRYRDIHPETRRWHGVSVAAGELKVDVARDCDETWSCAIVQIKRDLGILNGNATREEKADALKFLMHFVGDIHEPLHVTNAGTGIGFSIRGTYFGRETNMHDLWDSDIITAENKPWPQLAEDLRKEITPAQRTAWVKASPEDWANESLLLTQRPEMKFGETSKDFAWGEAYQQANVAMVRQRLEQAAVRLSYLINEILGDAG